MCSDAPRCVVFMHRRPIGAPLETLDTRRQGDTQIARAGALPSLVATLGRMKTWALAGALIPVLALSSCALLPAPTIDVSQVPKDVQSPFADTGPKKDRSAVRASLVDALSAQEDQLARTEQGAPRQSTSARDARLRSVESASMATSDLAAMAYLTATDTPFRSSQFNVTTWQGVAVRGDYAKAYVLGNNTYLGWDGSTRTGATWQYKALLKRDPHAANGWILTESDAASNEQG